MGLGEGEEVGVVPAPTPVGEELRLGVVGAEALCEGEARALPVPVLLKGPLAEVVGLPASECDPDRLAVAQGVPVPAAPVAVKAALALAVAEGLAKMTVAEGLPVGAPGVGDKGAEKVRRELGDTGGEAEGLCDEGLLGESELEGQDEPVPPPPLEALAVGLPLSALLPVALSVAEGCALAVLSPPPLPLVREGEAVAVTAAVAVLPPPKDAEAVGEPETHELVVCVGLPASDGVGAPPLTLGLPETAAVADPPPPPPPLPSPLLCDGDRVLVAIALAVAEEVPQVQGVAVAVAEALARRAA